MINLEKGKIPPQAVDIEEVTLGAMLIDRKGVDEVLEVIKTPDVFYKDAHRKIFEAIIALDLKSEPVDILTVSHQLKSVNELASIGGDHYLIQLTMKVAGAAHSQYHARILLQKYIARTVIKLGNQAIEWGYDSTLDVFDMVDNLGVEFDKINEIINTGHNGMDWATAMDEVPKKVEHLTNSNGELTGIPTGLDRLNSFFNGWQPSDFIVIGADSGMGKTALAMRFILSAAQAGYPVAMLSMEMSTMQLAIRAVAVESHFHMGQLTKTGLEKAEYFIKLQKTTDSLRGLPVHVDDRPSVTVPEMKRRARHLKRKHDIKFLLIDFIQMFTGEDDDVKLTGYAARECKNIAKELNIPVIALSQLNREVRKARYNLPEKYHLKNSSGIEEAADIITLLYRPGAYNIKPEDAPDLYQNELGLTGYQNAALRVVKYRNGAQSTIPLQYVENKTKYVNDNEFNQEEDTPF